MPVHKYHLVMRQRAVAELEQLAACVDLRLVCGVGWFDTIDDVRSWQKATRDVVDDITDPEARPWLRRDGVARARKYAEQWRASADELGRGQRSAIEARARRRVARFFEQMAEIAPTVFEVDARFKVKQKDLDEWEQEQQEKARKTKASCNSSNALTA